MRGNAAFKNVKKIVRKKRGTAQNGKNHADRHGNMRPQKRNARFLGNVIEDEIGERRKKRIIGNELKACDDEEERVREGSFLSLQGNFKQNPPRRDEREHNHIGRKQPQKRRRMPNRRNAPLLDHLQENDRHHQEHECLTYHRDSIHRNKYITRSAIIVQKKRRILCLLIIIPFEVIEIFDLPFPFISEIFF